MVRARLLLVGLLSTVAAAQPAARSFTPTRMEVPITSIHLSGPGVSTDLFQCQQDGGCRVDLADAGALRSLFSGTKSIPSATYNSLNFKLCNPDAAPVVSLEASLSSRGQLWHTTSAPEQWTTDAGSAGTLTLPFSKWCSMVVPVKPPLFVDAGSTLDLSALFSLQNEGWAMLGQGGNTGLCADGTTHSTCLGYLTLVPLVGTAAPRLMSFHVTDDLTDDAGLRAGGQVLVLVDPSGRAFAAVYRRLFLDDTQGTLGNFDPGPLVKDNGDGTWDFADAISTTNPLKPFLRFPRFELRTHTGNYETIDGLTVPYRAVLQ